MSYSVPDPADKTQTRIMAGSNAANGAPRQCPETLDLGLEALERCKSCLDVAKPSQIGVGWFLAECVFGVFQLLI